MRYAVLYVCLALAATAAAEQAVFEAAAPENGLRLVGEAVTGEIGGQAVVSPPVNESDYFKRAALMFRVPDGFAQAPYYLVLEYFDTGLGRIQVTDGIGLAGTTCLGTAKPRRALFRLGDAVGEIRVEGVSNLRRAVLKTALDPGEAEAIAAEVPAKLAPRVTLSRPMQLVMSVGADARRPEELPDALSDMRDLCPLAATLGFNGVESYVKWDFIERTKGEYDWSFYDGIVAEAQRHGLRWFPLLIVGSAYSLPEWYHDSPENVGFACLEHGQSNNIQTIFCENQTPHVQAFLKAFGDHYEPMDALLGVRLGPSGNYGESQYPAGGNWGYQRKPEHIHIGWWAGDIHADAHFSAWLRARYGTIDALNEAWGASYAGWGEVQCFIPQTAESTRKRKDFVDWYMGAMSDWCERWALWAREGLPKTPIYQSAGGWGFVECGTDFNDQTASMAKVDGGVRVTNETDSYAQNFQVTRMASSAARFYGVDFGSEPAGFNSAKGVASRIYNVLVNDGDHLFFYYPNLLTSDQGVQTWLDLAPLLDRRAEPAIDVAALYPDTLSKIDDGVFRNLYASSFYQRVATLRPHVDFDYCSERMVLDGALPRYKALVFLWSHTIEGKVLDAIDAWVRDGGTVIALDWDRLPLQTVEGDGAVYRRWAAGDTGRGKALLIREDREPPHRYTDRVREALLAMPDLHPLTQAVLRTEKPSEVYLSALENGTIAALNYNDRPAEVRVPGAAPVTIPPYRIALIPSP